VVSRDEMLERLQLRFGAITPVAEPSSAPAARFTLPDGTVFGIIASTTAPFCARCDRSRLTADGIWYRCLYATAGTDMRRVLRSAATPGEIAERIADLVGSVWRVRTDRGAEQRKANDARTAFVPLDALQCDPHFEMHTRGG
jgi:cyclic pyranopterin phosphate synthase